MKILLFDDSPIHRHAGEILLKDHQLTIVSTYDEAEKALTPQFDYEKQKKLLLEAGYKTVWRTPEMSDEEAAAFEVVRKRTRREATTYPDFDVVLTDLLVPASGSNQGGEGRAFVGQEMPLGMVIALLALRAGVKKVAVVTDMNHHHHPASAAMDAFRGEKGGFAVGDAKVICTNQAVVSVDTETFECVDWKYLQSKESQEKYPRTPDYERRGITHVKDWGAVLQSLIQDRPAEDE